MKFMSRKLKREPSIFVFEQLHGIVSADKTIFALFPSFIKHSIYILKFLIVSAHGMPYMLNNQDRNLLKISLCNAYEH